MLANIEHSLPNCTTILDVPSSAILRYLLLTSLLGVLSISPAQQQLQDNVPLFGTTVVESGGLRGNVYFISDQTRKLPDFETLQPVGVIYTSQLNVPVQDFSRGFPGITSRFEWFAIDYTGNVWIAKPGYYRFRLVSDDGARLYIDDQLIADNDGTHSPIERLCSLNLSLGVHHIRVSYFQGPRFQVALSLFVAPPGEKFRFFNTDEFKPPPNPETWVQQNSTAPVTQDLPAEPDASQPKDAPEPFGFGSTTAIPGALKGYLYAAQPSITHVPDFSRSQLLATLYALKLDVTNQDPAAVLPRNWRKLSTFGILYHGNFWLANPGLYHFSLSSSDSATLFIDHQLIADNQGPFLAGVERRASLRLARGAHSIDLSYVKSLHTPASLRLLIAPPGQPFRLFDTNQLSR